MKDSVGRYLTRALFKELASKETRDKFPPVFTLEDARIIYLEAEDPTEYIPSQKLLGSWQHWLVLLESPDVRFHIDRWREELEVRLRSKGVMEILDISKGDKGFQAAKWLADKGWESKKAGRPTKEKVNYNKRVEATMKKEYEDDAKRLSLTH